MWSQARAAAPGLSEGAEISPEALPATGMQQGICEADNALSRLVSLYGTQDPESSLGSAGGPDARHQDADSPRSQNGIESETHRILHRQTEDSDAGASLDKNEPERQHAETPMKGSAALNGAVQANLGQARQVQSAAAQPPAEVQGIIAKLMQFIKVRLSPLVPLWRSALLHSCGACRGNRRTAAWHVAAAAVAQHHKR